MKVYSLNNFIAAGAVVAPHIPRLLESLKVESDMSALVTQARTEAKAPRIKTYDIVRSVMLEVINSTRAGGEDASEAFRASLVEAGIESNTVSPYATTVKHVVNAARRGHPSFTNADGSLKADVILESDMSTVRQLCKTSDEIKRLEMRREVASWAKRCPDAKLQAFYDAAWDAAIALGLISDSAPTEADVLPEEAEA